MLPFEDVCMPALELKAREVEAIPLGLFWLLTKLCSPLCFCQEDTNGLMPLVFNDFPVGRGFVVLAPFSAGSVSAVVFVAVLPPKKIQAPKSAEERPSMEMLVELVTEQLAGALYTATVPHINL